MAIEIVGFPIKNGGSFHCYVAVHQRVNSSPMVFRMPELRSLTRCWLKPAFMSSPLPSCVSKALRRRTWKKGWEPCGNHVGTRANSLCFFGVHMCMYIYICGFLWFWCVFLEVLICFQVPFGRVLRVLPAKMVPSEDATPSTSSSESTKDSPSPKISLITQIILKKNGYLMIFAYWISTYYIICTYIYIYVYNYTYTYIYYIIRLEYANTVDLGFHSRITN